ncbi:hypothetical protein MHIR_DE00485 [Candidatus Doolittlea endobia]|uniref:Uncharacterized protein n=1 Tax=Candidatus Doolittlea endobia TaxID=1778262 RepID=A0A143WSP3_9ENTR|nr:hypothetical protein MHIR_DE00485 [Candidatus Doolittlea endobia]
MLQMLTPLSSPILIMSTMTFGKTCMLLLAEILTEQRYYRENYRLKKAMLALYQCLCCDY